MNYKDIFQTMPADQNQATLILPCIRGQRLGEKPLNWEIPLSFVPAPTGMPIYPVLDLPTRTPLSTDKSAVESGFSLSLEQMAETPDGYYIKARLAWQEDPNFSTVQLFPDAVRVVDSAGQDVMILDMLPEASEKQSLPISLKIGQPAHPGPVQVIVDYVAQDLNVLADTVINLDLGENPMPGQTWDVNQDVAVQGYFVRVLSAEYIQESPQAPALLMLNLQAKPDVLMAQFMDSETTASGHGGSSPNSGYSQFRSAISYPQFPKGKIKLTLSSLAIRRNGPWSATWTPPAVDPNTAPRQLASPVTDTRDGFTVTVESAVLTASQSTVTYLVQALQPFDTEPGVRNDLCFEQTRLRLSDGREKISSNQEGSGTNTQMQYTETFPAFRADEIPVSLVIPCIFGVPLNQGPQNWEIPLQFVPGAPPTSTPIPTITFTGKACLDQAAFQAALDGPQATLPAGLSGRIVSWKSNNEFGEMFLSNLDGSNRESLGVGIFPALSPDGKSLVYRGADSGLHIRNLTSGSDAIVPGSIQPKVNNNNPAWSPDGKQIVISRFANDNLNIYLVNADGSNLHGFITSSKQESFLGWAPDSRSLSYTTYEEEIHHVYVLDMQSGKSREIATLPPGTSMFSLSPDGKRIVFGNSQGIFIANTNDFAPTLLVEGSLNLNMPLVWSPDNQWLGLGYWGTDGHGPVRMALLQPDTCQFLLLQGSGEILSSWVR
jgi:hypothetical protein